MPYLNLRLLNGVSPETVESIANVLFKHTGEILGKRREVTSIDVEIQEPKRWFIGGKAVHGTHESTFYLNVKVTDGTNTKDEKARYIAAVFADMERVLGAVHAASYIVIDDVRADAWGFGGKTQEERFIAGRKL